MKKIILLTILPFIILFFSGCSFISPVLGEYRYDPGSTRTSVEVWDSKIGCLTDTSALGPEISFKQYLIFEPNKITSRRETYSTPGCTNAYAYYTEYYNYITRGLVATKSVKTDGAGNVKEDVSDVLAYKIDMVKTEYTIECKNQTCVSDQNLNISNQVLLGGDKATYCGPLVFSVGASVNYLKCNAAQGKETSGVWYQLLYYDFFNDKVYIGSNYAKVSDNQPGNSFSGSSDSTRPKYTEEGSVFLKPPLF